MTMQFTQCNHLLIESFHKQMGLTHCISQVSLQQKSISNAAKRPRGHLGKFQQTLYTQVPQNTQI